ncbi:cysteine-rich venom protein Mr30-like [Anneissia japonica]|uniref:cysteine-rich venom protein Mr30-like n=1 Tax=Anneissia japonica TaxID=1529436 RepID=UPI00142583C8|nr:cysteine-rich venom protein Mr30-like [Anneissia japonica]
MLQRYLVVVIAFFVIFQRGFAETPRIMKSNKSIKVIPASEEIHSRKRRSTAFTAEQIQAIVDRHNYHRRNVSPGPASNMEYMEWDDNLATMAQQWSDGCHYGHGQPTPNLTPYSWIGQNLYASSNDGTNGVQATDAWNNEDQYYDYEYNNCTHVCGHYTQNVWATSNRIGCGVRFCNNPSGLSWATANIITCNYGPGGNYVGQRPYLLGPACSECSSGVGQCDNGLCRPCADHSGPCVCEAICQNCGTVTDDCTCECQDGFIGVDCSRECGNYHMYCGAGWYPNWCDDEHPYVPENCPLMCGLCVEVDPNFECNSTTVKPTTEKPSTEEPRPSTEAPPPPTEEPHPPTTEPRPSTHEPLPPTTEPVGGCDLHCENGGVCTEDGKDGFCDCPLGFGGRTCRRVVVYCPCNRPN